MMGLFEKVAALAGPDRAVDALEKQARSYSRWWLIFGAICIALAWPFKGLPAHASLISAAVFLVGSGIAHLFGLLSAALAARGL